MKKILLILALITSLFAANDDFLSPSEAFDVNVFEKQTSVDINVKLPKTIYLYDEKIKILVNKIDITKDIFSKKPEQYQEFMVHFGGFNLVIPKEKIKSLIGNTSQYKVEFQFQGCSVKGLCYAPMNESYSGSFASTKDSTPINNIEQKDESGSISDILLGGNIFLILATFFGFGLLLAFTPCIFPMIPILSSIIVKHSKKDGGKMSTGRGFILSLVYVLSMSAAYTIAGILAGLFGANIQAILQNPVVLIVFSGVFVALAFSLFGYFSLELPVSFQTKINNLTGAKDNNGMTGVAAMGFLSALIVGPCVAPPLAGALIYIGQTGDAVLGGLALFVMSLGLGMPLLLVGAGAGKYMPKPGGWMETVSKVFGIIMLALAVYMIDRIVPSMVTFILYALLALFSAYYLFRNYQGIFAKVLALIMIIISVYFGYLSMNIKEAHIQFTYVKTSQELNKALASTTKPVMLDFWASWCVSCKELEEITFADSKVQEFLSSYLLLKIDITENTEEHQLRMKSFNGFGPPALIFWDAKGQEEKSKKIVGYKNAKAFMKIVNK
jgi:thiol:disulfide interchange protein DsbD